MLHPGRDHYLLAPTDLPAHITEDHRVDLTRISYLVDVAGWMEQHGVESTGDRTLDVQQMWHCKVHDREEYEQISYLVGEFLAADIAGFSLVAAGRLAQLALLFGLPDDATTEEVDRRIAEVYGDARAR
jgi:hypothetical protein